MILFPLFCYNYTKQRYTKGTRMFEEERNISTLSQKITELLEKYKDLLAQNEILRQEVVKSKALAEAKNVQITKLEQDLINKDVNADDLLSKIEAVLGR